MVLVTSAGMFVVGLSCRLQRGEDENLPRFMFAEQVSASKVTSVLQNALSFPMREASHRSAALLICAEIIKYVFHSLQRLLVIGGRRETACTSFAVK